MAQRLVATEGQHAFSAPQLRCSGKGCTYPGQEPGACWSQGQAATDATMLEAKSPPPGQSVLITNADHDGITADLRDAEANLDDAREVHWQVPARLPLAQVNTGQQVLDVQAKLITLSGSPRSTPPPPWP